MKGGHVASAVEARGGFLSKPTLAVLIVSTALTLLSSTVWFSRPDFSARVRARRYLIT